MDSTKTIHLVGTGRQLHIEYELVVYLEDVRISVGTVKFNNVLDQPDLRKMATLIRQRLAKTEEK